MLLQPCLSHLEHFVGLYLDATPSLSCLVVVQVSSLQALQISIKSRSCRTCDAERNAAWLYPEHVLIFFSLSSCSGNVLCTDTSVAPQTCKL